MTCVRYGIGLTYAMRVCEALEEILGKRHPDALVMAEPFIGGRETGMMLRCHQLDGRRPMREPLAWVYAERLVGALEVVLGDTTHDYEIGDTNACYGWAYEHDRLTYGDDETVPEADVAAEAIATHFERICEEYSRPDWMS